MLVIFPSYIDGLFKQALVSGRLFVKREAQDGMYLSDRLMPDSRDAS